VNRRFQQSALPGGELVAQGLADLAEGAETVESLLVSVGAPRLRGLGVDVCSRFADPEERLYLLLARDVPEQERAIPRLKDGPSIDVELAASGDFIPLPAGWEERSPSAGPGRTLSFRHFDPYSQALAKLERDHARDREDVRALVASGLVDPGRLGASFDETEPLLYRFPAIDPPAFRARVDAIRTAR
jgi:hypothetical protein